MTRPRNTEYKRAQRARKAAGVELPPGRPPASIRHGTEAGAKQHRRRGEQPCEACRAGEAAARRAYRAKK